MSSSLYGRDIPKSWNPAIEDAECIFEEFYWRPPDGAFFFPNFLWPTLQGCCARALRIGYTSDKFGEKDEQWIDYTHKHLNPRPRVIRQWVWGDKPVRKPIRRPNPPVLIKLGYCLDLGFRTLDRRLEHWDYLHMGRGNLPLLGWAPKQNCLVIQPQDGSMPVLVDSPILRVTERGIIN